MKKKCILIFITGMLVTMSAYAFFNMMQMPQKLMQMPQQFVCSECSCEKAE